MRLDAVDLGEVWGRCARFFVCGLEGCAVEITELFRGWFIDWVLSGVRGVCTDIVGLWLGDVVIVDARVGGVQLLGAVLVRVLFRGGMFVYLNLRK
ncbi:pentapeptide repeat-containing protein, partial [Streptomyces sp. BE230]|nr:pentapeptide repeat-containing protein [Streptomyces sp. BE230]